MCLCASAQLHSYISTQLHSYTSTHMRVCAYACWQVCMFACTKVRRAHCAYAPDCAYSIAYARMRMGMHKGLYVCMRVCGYAGMRVCGYAGMRVCGYAGMLPQMPTCCMRACALAYTHVAVYALASAGMRIRGGVRAVARLFNDRDGASAQLHSYTSTQLHSYTSTHMRVCAYA